MAEQINKSWYRYVTDGGVNMGVMVETDWGANVASGFTAFNAADPVFGPQSRTHHIRKIVYKDPATFRVTVRPFGTGAAFTAAPATVTQFIPGNVAAVTYNIAQRRPEKMRIPGPSNNLADHA